MTEAPKLVFSSQRRACATCGHTSALHIQLRKRWAHAGFEPRGALPPRLGWVIIRRLRGECKAAFFSSFYLSWNAGWLQYLYFTLNVGLEIGRGHRKKRNFCFPPSSFSLSALFQSTVAFNSCSYKCQCGEAAERLPGSLCRQEQGGLQGSSIVVRFLPLSNKWCWDDIKWHWKWPLQSPSMFFFSRVCIFPTSCVS